MMVILKTTIVEDRPSFLVKELRNEVSILYDTQSPYLMGENTNPVQRMGWGWQITDLMTRLGTPIYQKKIYSLGILMILKTTIVARPNLQGIGYKQGFVAKELDMMIPMSPDTYVARPSLGKNANPVQRTPYCWAGQLHSTGCGILTGKRRY